MTSKLSKTIRLRGVMAIISCVLPDRSHVDCLTSTHAFEAEWVQGFVVLPNQGVK
jgi:hypothetical protein